jgi:hypothetical protein
MALMGIDQTAYRFSELPRLVALRLHYLGCRTFTILRL